MLTSSELGLEKIVSEAKRKMKMSPFAQEQKMSRAVKINYYFIQ